MYRHFYQHAWRTLGLYVLLRAFYDTLSIFICLDKTHVPHGHPQTTTKNVLMIP
jgi:hypothetical protein